VPTPNGDVRVELTGAIDRFSAPTGGEYMVLSMTRLLTGQSLPEAGVSATTGSIVTMPVLPTDVLSFEIPGAARSRGAARGGGGVAVAAGGGVARAGGGGGGGGTGAEVRRSPAGALGQAAGTAQAGARGGGGGRGSETPAASGRVLAPSNAQVAALLEGHQFAIRLRVTQVQ
jgi:hypothetical protein